MEQISKVSAPWASSSVLSSSYLFHLRFLLHAIAVVGAVVQVLQELLPIQFRDNPNMECSVRAPAAQCPHPHHPTPTFNSHTRNICPRTPVVCISHSCWNMLASLIAALYLSILKCFAAGCFTNGPRQSARREVEAQYSSGLNLFSLQLLSILLDSIE